ncbi:hypothetical protein C4572_01910 [Candidatus Parcubacteria bacterium]|nr:MAG: hypothetical protein C4572_01910 [Candidatus Parcubacteria bacterium]
MELMKKIALKNIHFAISLSIIIVLFTASSALIIVSGVKVAQAFYGRIGLAVRTAPMKCVPDPDASTCLGSCPFCGSLAGVCSGLFEIQALYLSGTPLLYMGQALCVPSPIPPNGGTFRPGSRCLGLAFGTGPHQLYNFGCYR